MNFKGYFIVVFIVIIVIGFKFDVKIFNLYCVVLKGIFLLLLNVFKIVGVLVF